MRNVQTRVVGLVGGGVGCWRVLLQGSAFDLQGRRASAAGRRARRMRFAAARGASGVAASSYIVYTTLRNNLIALATLPRTAGRARFLLRHFRPTAAPHVASLAGS